MLRNAIVAILAVACAAPSAAATGSEPTTREFRAAAGGRLTLDLKAGGSVEITGTGGSSVSVTYTLSCTPECAIAFDETGGGLKITTVFKEHKGRQSSDIEIKVRVPRSFDVKLDSMGGGVSIAGVEGKLAGETKGGELTLHDVRGEVKLETMGGKISVTDSTLDGYVKTMGGDVTLENVVGDVQGSSMGGNVRYKNVRRRDGQVASPERVGKGLDEVSPDSVQISTMGGEIEVKDAPEGADLHTMGGNIMVKDARRFVRARTMGGDIEIGSVDGWVQATTMGGDIDVTVTGKGGDVTLTSNAGEITLHVPPGFGMDLDLQIAYTRNSRQEYRIEAPGGLKLTVSPEWDYDKGTPRKYIRAAGAANGGGIKVKIETINGNITVKE
jgi:DUF4097 and DUF4098 domain-containing protein YvlB